MHSFESMLGVRENFHSIHPSGVHTFFSKTSYDQWFFFKEKLEVISFQKHVGFSARQLIFLFLTFSFFSLLALFFPYLLSSFQFIFFFSIFIFIMIFVCFTYIFFDNVPKRRILHGSRISNIIDSNDINTNATIQTKMYALYKWQSKQQKQTLVSQVKTIT